MAAARQLVEKDHYTEEEYFAFEEAAFERWEYVRGKIRAMSGGIPNHSAIAINVGAALRTALLPKGCRVFGSDLKIHTGDDTNTYPDVSVVCGPLSYHRDRNDVITNPLLVVEVLSGSTEGYDRGEKFDHYQTIGTLHDYLLVEQDAPRVLLDTRDGGQWQCRVIFGLESHVHLPSLDVILSLSDIYALVDFSSA